MVAPELFADQLVLDNCQPTRCHTRLPRARVALFDRDCFCGIRQSARSKHGLDDVVLMRNGEQLAVAAKAILQSTFFGKLSSLEGLLGNWCPWDAVHHHNRPFP